MPLNRGEYSRRILRMSDLERIWTQIINGMTIYTDADLKVYLEQAGFGRVQSHKNKKGWLCVTAQK